MEALYTVEIDFDDASLAWRSNKKSKGNCTYIYCCMQVTKQGKKCIRTAVNNCDFCKMHQKTSTKK